MILTSWKEIASRLNCAVRTAQRWERNGLPVSRTIPGRRGYVTADAEMLESWLRDSVFWRRKDLVRLSEIQRCRILRAHAKHSRETLHEKMASLTRQAELLRITANTSVERLAKIGPGRTGDPR